jgi:hypothetical protein
MRIISPAELASLKGITFSNPHRLYLEAAGKFPSASSSENDGMAISKMNLMVG